MIARSIRRYDAGADGVLPLARHRAALSVSLGGNNSALCRCPNSTAETCHDCRLVSWDPLSGQIHLSDWQVQSQQPAVTKPA